MNFLSWWLLVSAQFLSDEEIDEALSHEDSCTCPLCTRFILHEEEELERGE